MTSHSRSLRSSSFDKPQSAIQAEPYGVGQNKLDGTADGIRWLMHGRREEDQHQAEERPNNHQRTSDVKSDDHGFQPCVPPRLEGRLYHDSAASLLAPKVALL